MQTILLLLLFPTAHCFLTTPIPVVVGRHHPHDVVGSRRWGLMDDNHHHENNSNSNNPFDLEAARQQLEALVGSAAQFDGALEQEEGNNNVVSKSIPKRRRRDDDHHQMVSLLPTPAPPLTSMDRERRQAEIEYLKQLQHGDDHLADIWTLWFQERGAQPAKLLLQAEELSSNSHTWDAAETLLKDLIETHTVYWAEPVNRLATLYYMQRRYQEAEELCKTVLQVKPWHFGALSGLVLVYAAVHDVEEARHWAAQRLPSFAPTGLNRRRLLWVERAVQQAETSLQQAEVRLKESFGEQDDYEALLAADSFEEDAWQ